MQMTDTTTTPAGPGAISPAGAAQALQALARSSAARTKAARLRELLPEIEAAQAAGVRHAHILETLNAHGLGLSMKSYSVMLHRLRQQRAKAGGANAPSNADQPAASVPAASTLSVKASGKPQPPAAAGPGATHTHPACNATSGAAPALRPGQPQNFDWEALKNVPPEW
jgi:hypothetical protein